MAKGTLNTLTYEDITQLLQETDCSDEFSQQFLAAMKAENVKNQLHLLRAQRSRQLERLHEEENKLDQLGYLRYILEKQLPVGEKNNQRGSRL